MRLHEHDSGGRRSPERGREFGRVWASRIHTAIAAYRRHYLQLGIDPDTCAAVSEKSCQALFAWHPALGEELESIAGGAGITVAELGLLNSRTEILAAAPPKGDGECSTVARARADGPPVAFQTWDWHPHLVPDAALWRYSPAPGRWVKTFTEPGMLAKIGLNSAGLGVNFNLLHHRADGAGDGVPVHAIARRILDEAGTVREAVDLARSATVSASTAITVTALAPVAEAVSIELTPAGTVAIPARADGWLIRTNHLLSPSLRDGDVRHPTSTTLLRYAHLDKALPAGEAAGGLPELAGRLCGEAGDEAPICMREDLRLPEPARRRTMLTVRLDHAGGFMEYWPGTPADVAEEGHARRF
ncbi:C45 family peptidase [Nonomuraea sp. NPDC048916]|uniref:C45 family peptidase n=1 Tax=Nonomuraea sp. NPDC048916 TaxID=3154232 RepID=UPI0033F31463